MPYPCVPGTYRADILGKTSADCDACPAGYYCKDYGSTNYEVCEEGWYCEGNEVSPTPTGKHCPKGSYCTQGVKQLCPNTRYQDKTGQSACLSCPNGYQCPYTDAVNKLGADIKKICGNNYYCPVDVNEKVACQDGYYTTTNTASSISSCVQCPAGYVCKCTYPSDSDICVAEFKKCDAGKYCPAGIWQDA